VGLGAVEAVGRARPRMSMFAVSNDVTTERFTRAGYPESGLHPAGWLHQTAAEEEF
jgi:hypothetical protein